MTFLRGLSAFPITPADQNGNIDEPALEKLLARLMEAKVDSIGLLGSTGTYMFLSRRQRQNAIEVAVDKVGADIPLLVGIGALRTDEAVQHAKDAKAIGATVGLLSAVSYAPLYEDEVFQHFRTVASESGLPICIYDNPGTTNFRFTPALVERLSRVPGIVAIKNPANDPAETRRHLEEQRSLVPEDFSIGYSGDWQSTEAMIAGADTWYSVLGGLLPGVCSRIVKAIQRGEAAEARRIDASLEPIWALFRRHSSLRVVYALAEALDLCHASPPLPIRPLVGDAQQDVVAALKQIPAEVCSQPES
ncbi:dihydrodipicolinate synthase family protein [Agrobacterium rhizogenes]|nr:dihydrodipicolinate synthase family protein [Rhizobium rhizogenes]NTH61822.1 dihydrodipicolinate synthase family protein [Rhizobium rhizogenes]NTH93448.1 dihydrodipicolinate synthase family protein [Rhizobium rhizogenes]